MLSVDEKGQIQALYRKKGRAGPMIHDYERTAPPPLFVALNVLDGTIVSRNMRRHRHQKFIRFLNAIEASVGRRGDPCHPR